MLLNFIFFPDCGVICEMLTLAYDHFPGHNKEDLHKFVQNEQRKQ